MNKTYLLILSILFFSCSKKSEVNFIYPQKTTVESIVTTINSGTVEAKKQAQLSFATVGRVSKIHVKNGSKVFMGQMIAELENQDLYAIYNEADKEWQRSTELFKNGLISQANIDNARKNVQIAKANLEKTIIKAPFSGMITTLNLNLGELFQNASIAANPIVQLIDLEKRIVKGNIDEIDLQKVKIGQNARVKIPALNNKILDAKVIRVVPFVSATKDQDRTSQIELEIESDELIPVGVSADVEIITESKPGVLAVPTLGLFGPSQDKFVYLIQEDKLIKKNIKVGLSSFEKTQILSGISENDAVATPTEGIELTEGLKVKGKKNPWP